MHVNVVHDREPDVVRGPAGSPRGPQGQGRVKDRPSADKRGSTVTRPISEDIASKKDDLVSTFGKRIDNGR
jgi:hypothetical protein